LLTVVRYWNLAGTATLAVMRIVAELIKDGEVIDTFTFDMATSDDLDASSRAFAYFRDRHPHMTVEADDVRIEFRDDKATS
jgi:hypothetical protein